MPSPLHLSAGDDSQRAGRMAEADHRISNSLAVVAGLVRLKATRGNPGDNPAAFLLEIAERIDSVARLHRHMAHSRTGMVQLGDYLRGICEGLNSALSRNGLSFALDCSRSIVVPFNIVLPLGLIVAELVTNSLKYAHPSGLPVKVSLSCAGTPQGELAIVYEDDGVGFPEDFDPAQDGHLGMRFIRLQSEQLGGKGVWESDPLGVRFAITFPLRRNGLAETG